MVSGNKNLVTPLIGADDNLRNIKLPSTGIAPLGKAKFNAYRWLLADFVMFWRCVKLLKAI